MPNEVRLLFNLGHLCSSFNLFRWIAVCWIAIQIPTAATTGTNDAAATCTTDIHAEGDSQTMIS